MKVKASLDKNILTVSFLDVKKSDDNQLANIGAELLKKLGNYGTSEEKSSSDVSFVTIIREHSGSQHLYLAKQVLRSFCFDV